MPTPFDLLSSKIEPPDPDDLLRNQLGQQQGKTLIGLGPPPQQGQMAQQGLPMMAQPSAVPGPLAAIPQMTQASKPKVKLKVKKAKPRIKLKAP
jgi:hypothetical protein